MLKKQTNKLFFKKYPYKVSCYIQGGWMLRSFGLSETKKYCETGQVTSWRWDNHFRPEIDGKNLLNFIQKIESYLPFIKTRIEQNVFNFYSTDRQVFENLLESLNPWIHTVWEPENQEFLDFLTSSNNVKILCDEYPYKKYRYKVYIKHKLDEETRKAFSNWIKNYPDKILSSGETKKWLENEFYFTWNPFVFVADQPTLSMIGMFLGSSIQKVEEYISKVSINTTL